MSQNSVGIGTENPSANAVLQLVSPTNNQGFLVPRLTTAQRTVETFTSRLTTADNGLMVFDTNLSTFFYWVANRWELVSGTLLTGGTGVTIDENGVISIEPDVPQDLVLANNQLRITNNTTATVIDLTPYLNIQNASQVVVTPTTTLTSATVQAALEELQAEILNPPGNMLKATYDPTNINGSAFDLTNHTGNLPSTRISGLGTAASLNVGTGSNNIVQLDGIGLPAVDGSRLTGLSLIQLPNLGDLAALDVVGSTEIADNSIVNADINATAQISGTKINPNFGTQNISTNGTIIGGSFTGDGSGLTNVPITPGSITDGSITGGTGTGAKIAVGTITDNNVSPTAAIAGTKITPNFGTQNISTSGTITGTTFTGDGSGLTNVPITVGSITDGSITGGTGVGAKIAASTITNDNISNTAAIAGTKIAPNFGTQNISTTGTITGGSFVGNGTGLTNVTVSDGTITGGTGAGAKIATSTITNDNISNTAAIVGTKITPNFGAQNITTTGTITAGSIIGNGAGLTNVTVSDGAITGGTGTGAKIAATTITNDNISGTAAILGTKISPDFGAQNINTTGIITGDGSGLTNVRVDDGSIFGGTGTGGKIASNTITNDNISPIAAILGTKISPNFGTQNISTSGTITGSSFTGDGSGLTNVGITDGSITGGIGIGAKIATGTITNDNISGTAAISGTKINPDFGVQNIRTNGIILANIVTINGGGLQISNGTEGLGKILVSGATGITSWQEPSSIGWGLTGNAGTVAGTNFIGTTDAQPLNFKVNNIQAGKIDISGNIFMGLNSGENNTANSNIFFGSDAGKANTSGTRNLFVGFESGLLNTVGSGNTFIGYRAGRVITGSRNVMIGENSGASIGNLSNAIAIGYNAIVGASNSLVLGGIAGTAVNVGIGVITPGQKLDIGAISGEDTYVKIEAGGTTSNFSGVLLTEENLDSGMSMRFDAQNDNLLISSQDNSLIFTDLFTVRQNGDVGIGTTTPAATLDIIGSIKITDGTEGAGKTLVSDANGLASWQTPESGWGLTGNAGTVDGTNFIGTTDAQPLNFKVNNIQAGKIGATGNNTLFGLNAGENVTTATNSTFIGSGAGQTNTTGSSNTFVGFGAGQANTGGFGNSFFGHQAGMSTRSVQGSQNAFYGYQSGISNTTGGSNSFFGHFSGQNNVDGIRNTFIGIEAGRSNVSGNQNVMIGRGADVTIDGLFNATAIGNNAKVGASKSMVLGGTGVDTVNVGIGVTIPLYTLHVNGSVAGTSPYNNLSDARFKRDIMPITGALTKINNLRGIIHYWDNTFDKNLKLDHKRHYGFIAQEIELVLPEVVNTAKDSLGMKTVEYSSVVPVLVEAIKELTAKIESLEMENELLRKDKTTFEANQSRFASELEQLKKLILTSRGAAMNTENTTIETSGKE